MKKSLHLKSADIPLGIITAVQYQKKDKLRASLFVDGQFAVGVNVSTIEFFRLRKGDEMTSILAEKMCVYDNLVSAKRVAAKFINTRMRSEKEVREKLRGFEFDSEVADEVVETLRRNMMLDDLAFAKSFIHDKLLSKPHSAQRLETDLRKKGIAKDIIHEALTEAGIGESEEERAMIAAEKKWQQIIRREDDTKKRKQKLTAFLASRGFKYDTIKTIITKLSGNGDEEEYDI
jgi:regulatory protein